MRSHRYQAAGYGSAALIDLALGVVLQGSWVVFVAGPLVTGCVIAFLWGLKRGAVNLAARIYEPKGRARSFLVPLASLTLSFLPWCPVLVMAGARHSEFRIAAGLAIAYGVIMGAVMTVRELAIDRRAAFMSSGDRQS